MKQNTQLGALRSKIVSASKQSWHDKDSAPYFQASDMALVRYLPPTADDVEPFVQCNNHAFKGVDGKWFMELCPGDPCPVCESVSEPLWNSSHKARHYWISNCWILDDPAQPANVGKVKLFKYGTTILNKINDATLGDNGFDPFDVETGAALLLRISQGSFPDYSGSTFQKPCPIVGGPESVAALLSKCQPLNELVAPSNFQSYEYLREKYRRIAGMKP